MEREDQAWGGGTQRGSLSSSKEQNPAEAKRQHLEEGEGAAFLGL